MSNNDLKWFEQSMTDYEQYEEQWQKQREQEIKIYGVQKLSKSLQGQWYLRSIYNRIEKTEIPKKYLAEMSVNFVDATRVVISTPANAGTGSLVLVSTDMSQQKGTARIKEMSVTQCAVYARLPDGTMSDAPMKMEDIMMKIPCNFIWSIQDDVLKWEAAKEGDPLLTTFTFQRIPISVSPSRTCCTIL